MRLELPRSFAIEGNSLAAVWALYVQQTWQKGAPGWDDDVQIREARGVRLYLTADADYDDQFYPYMAASSQLQALDKLVSARRRKSQMKTLKRACMSSGS